MIERTGKKWIGIGCLLLLTGAAVSVLAGNASVSTGELLKALLQRREAGGMAVLILYRIRIPRVLAGIVCGAALSAAGYLLQEALHNNLASPGIMGVNGGAGLFALLSALLFGPRQFVRSGMAFAGAVCAMLLVLMITRYAGRARTTMVLAGVAVSSLMSAGVNLILTIRPESATDKTAFQLGSLQWISPEALGIAAALVLPGLAAAIALSKGIDLFALGDETAQGLGLPVQRYRVLTVLTATLLAAAAVSICGLIGFIGLIVPNLIRKTSVEGSLCRILLCALFGASFLVLSDLIARTIAYPYELPVGMLLSLLGAPFFILLLIRRKRGHR